MLWCRHCKEYHPDTAEFWLPIVTRGKRCRYHYAQTTKRWREKNKDRVRLLNKESKDTPGTKFSTLRSNANKRRLQVTISVEEYTTLISCACEYCGSTTKIGVDRKDNSVGYLPGNCVPACAICNLTRNNLYTYEEFKSLIAPAIRKVLDERQAQTTSVSGQTA